MSPMTSTPPLVLGVDFGHVIHGGRGAPGGAADTAFLSGPLSAALATPAVPGAFDSLTRLNRSFAGRVWIVSKCGPRIQERTERWLAHHHFFERTGIDPAHLRFCRQRPEKAIHCAELGVTHFVDDRADVLEHLVGLVDHLYLFGTSRAPHGLTAHAVADWPRAEAALHATLAVLIPQD
jgi:hypothetical protein